MTEREEEIRQRMNTIRAAADRGDHVALSRALKVAQEVALEDVAFLIAYLDATRKYAGVTS